MDTRYTDSILTSKEFSCSIASVMANECERFASAMLAIAIALKQIVSDARMPNGSAPVIDKPAKMLMYRIGIAVGIDNCPVRSRQLLQEH